ncbi:MAG: S1C family serine protease [Acidobacteria bacterium]|nr:S1C family serine protease [Acidobacteriota bacterium]
METTNRQEKPLLTFSNDLADAVERAGRGVVAINARERIPSSGVLWREALVITAAHTIKRDSDITVMLPEGRTTPAILVGMDTSTDVAVLKLDEAGGIPVEIGDAAELRVGHIVLAVGRVSERGVSASLGIVSAAGGEWRTWRGGRIDRFIRLDMGIYDGFSGSPLVDASGRVSGVNTSGLSRGGALTIPASTVSRVADELLAKGHIARAYIGVGLQPVPLPDSIKAKLNLANASGVIILSTEPNGPADKAGVLIGDVLVTLSGASVADIDDVQAALGPERVGQVLDATVVRAGELVHLKIKVDERPASRR